MARLQKGVKDTRRRQVAIYYFLHNLSIKEIAEKLDWTEPVIYEDVKQLTAQIELDLSAKNIFEREVQSYRERYKVASVKMNIATDDKTKALWLSQMHTIHKDMVEILFRK